MTGGSGASFGNLATACWAPLTGGKKRSSAHKVAAKQAPVTNTAATAMRNARERPNRRIGAVA